MKACNKRRQKVIGQLVASLKDKDSSIRKSAADILANIGWKPVNQAEQSAYFIASFKWDELIKIGAPVVEQLIFLIEDEDIFFQVNAARVLGCIGDARAVEPLVKMLKANRNSLIDSVFKVFRGIVNFFTLRAKTIVSFYYRLPQRVIKKAHSGKLRPATCIDKSLSVKISVIEALGSIGDLRVVEPLFFALKDKNPDIKKCAFNALYRIGEGAIKFLTTALKDKDKERRGNAAAVLGRIGAPRALNPLIARLKDKEASVRKSSVKALGQIGENYAVKPLLVSLEDRDPTVREVAAEALGIIADPLAMESLIVSLKDKAPLVREGVAKALGRIKGLRAAKALIPSLKDKDLFVRMSAVKALGSIGDPCAVKPLMSASKDECKYVKFAAIDSLGKIADPQAVSSLIEILKKGETYDIKMLAAKTLKRIKRPYIILPNKKNARDETSKAAYSIKMKPWSKLKGNFLPA